MGLSAHTVLKFVISIARKPVHRQRFDQHMLLNQVYSLHGSGIHTDQCVYTGQETVLILRSADPWLFLDIKASTTIDLLAETRHAA